uniref:Non-specific serine/threonine protein kinase n=1 Tax=Accipiter nisus TaxID=211598 RepID=A0A8B9MTY5_9AVES
LLDVSMLFIHLFLLKKMNLTFNLFARVTLILIIFSLLNFPWFLWHVNMVSALNLFVLVGYILGLGDRHVQNILIDEQTAELVHIDLGVAFEQGKILPTPETVPFRLTRDIVDGMGITGVEGVFRRCCEKTMTVMRNSQEALLTIADMSSTPNTDPQECKRKARCKIFFSYCLPTALLPCFMFFLLSVAHVVQNPYLVHLFFFFYSASNDDQSFNKVAERVLMRLQEKLKGVEEGTVLSVGGQVNLLIQQAMDPKNLSQLFPGWKPWV